MSDDKYVFPDEAGDTGVVDDHIDFEVEDSDLDVEVVDDTPVEDRDRKPMAYPVDDVSDEELASYSKRVQSRMKELTLARHEERRNKEVIQREKSELEALTRRLLEENRGLKKYVNTGEQVMAQTLKQAAESELDVARRAYREAHESFDTDAIMDAQEKWTEAKLKFEQAKNFRPNSLQVEDDSVYMSQPQQEAPQVDEQTTRWMARNPWFGDRTSDLHDEMTIVAMAVHNQLVKNGVDPRSSEYFERIDARVRSRFPEVFGETKQSKKPASVVASGVRTSSNARKVKLTQTQVALANKWNIPLEEFARQVALQQEKANG